MKRSSLTLLAALALAGSGCADLLGVEALSGVDAGAEADAAVPADAAASADVLVPGPLLDAGGAGCTITWVEAGTGQVPPGSVPNDLDAGVTGAIYVCRASTPTLGTVPGKLLPGWACYYGDGQSEQLATRYEALVLARCAAAWAPAPSGVVPADALVCGADLDGGTLYACRAGASAAYPGTLGHMGWSTNHACVYSNGGQSLSSGDFDVLTAE